MTNLEHIMQDPELVKKLIMGKLAVKKGAVCNCVPLILNGKLISGVTCDTCDFNNLDNDCSAYRQNYLEAEYKPVPKLTKREKAFLDALIPNKYTYFARNYSGGLFLYDNKPRKSHSAWVGNSIAGSGAINKYVFGDIFPFITWDDKEPVSIEWLRTLDVEKGVLDE